MVNKEKFHLFFLYNQDDSRSQYKPIVRVALEEIGSSNKK